MCIQYIVVEQIALASLSSLQLKYMAGATLQVKKAYFSSWFWRVTVQDQAAPLVWRLLKVVEGGTCTGEAT